MKKFKDSVLKKVVDDYDWRVESRFNQIIANNPVLYKQALGTGYLAVASAKLLIRAAQCETGKDIHALAQEYKAQGFVFMTPANKEGRQGIW